MIQRQAHAQGRGELGSLAGAFNSGTDEGGRRKTSAMPIAATISAAATARSGR